MGTVLERNAVRVSGVPGGRPIVFAHGFGCDQGMWRFVAPDFEVDHRVVLFDQVGSGNSDLSAYDPEKYGSLRGYAADLVEICRELELSDVVFVGHSVSAMIGVLAVQQAPELFGALVMVGPSPRYVDDGDYTGGFSPYRHRGAAGLAGEQPPRLVGPDGAGDHGQPGPAGARRGADQQLLPHRSRHRQPVRAGHLPVGQPRATWPPSTIPTLVLQCSDDVIAPEVVGRYVHEAIPGSVFTKLAATGHCPNLSAPEETTAAIRAFLSP